MKTEQSVLKNLAIGFVRWVALGVMIRFLLLPPNEPGNLFFRNMILAAVLFNLAVTIPGKSMRFRMTNFMTVIFDAAFIGLFAYFSPIHNHYWVFFFMLPVLYSGIDYGTDGGSMSAVVVSLSHGFIGLLQKYNSHLVGTVDQAIPELGPVIGFLGLYLFFGLVIGQLSLTIEGEKKAGGNMHRVTEQLDATIRFLGVAGDKAHRSAKQLAEAIKLIGSTAYQGVSMNTGMDSIFDQLIKGAVAVLGAQRGMIMIADENKKTLARKAVWGESCDKLPKALSFGEDTPGWVAETGQSLIITKNDFPEKLSDICKTRDVLDSLVAPILIDGAVAGILMLENKKEGTFDPEDMKVMDTVAGEAAMVIVNAELYRETMDKKKSLERMIKEVQSAQEKERRRIARDLHDGTAQNLAKLSLDLGVLKISGLKKRERNEELERLEAGVQETINELRNLIYDLRPASLDSFGLVATLEQYVKKYGAETGIEVELRTEVNNRLPEEYEINLFRVAQEALNNIKKYAGVNKAVLSIKSTPEEVVMDVADKGKGFEPDAVDLIGVHDHNFGLLGMRERLDALSGSLSIRSTPGKGTVITARLPATARGEVLIEAG